MSESFFIKKTAFNDNGTLSQRAKNSFIVGPGELNGPAGVSRNSDLRIYGFGALKWGEGVNQNLIRLLENNACPEKVLGDYNPFHTPTTDPLELWYDYNPAIHLKLPKDEKDLGRGNGITLPVIGQPWFNVDNELLYIYTSSGWSILGDRTAMPEPSVTQQGWNYLGELLMEVEMGGDSGTIIKELTQDCGAGISLLGDNYSTYSAMPINTMAFKFSVNSYTKCNNNTLPINLSVIPHTNGQGSQSGTFYPDSTPDVAVRKESYQLQLDWSGAAGCTGAKSWIIGVHVLLDGYNV